MNTKTRHDNPNKPMSEARARHLVIGCAIAVLGALALGTDTGQQPRAEETTRNTDIVTIKQQIEQSTGETVKHIDWLDEHNHYQVQQGTRLSYVSASGEHYLVGDLIDLRTGENLSETRRQNIAVNMINNVPTETLISWPAEKERTQIHVFFDVQCGYCRELHKQVADYNEMGISLFYLANPIIAGGTESKKIMKAVWCSEDRQAALEAALSDEEINATPCIDPVDFHQQTAQSLNIFATPTLVLENGSVINGFMPAPALKTKLSELGIEVN